MSEKRFRVGLDDVYFNCIEDFVFDAEVDCMIDNAEVVELLNEQQTTIRELKEEMVRLHKMSIELRDRVIPNLRRENEQLRQEIERLKKELDEKCP